MHAGVAASDLIEQMAATAGDNDLIAESVKRLSQTAADAARAAGDKNGVASELHWFCLWVQMKWIGITSVGSL